VIGKQRLAELRFDHDLRLDGLPAMTHDLAEPGVQIR
jgi:hypothetical protein